MAQSNPAAAQAPRRFSLSWDAIRSLMTNAYSEWSKDEVPRLGAALAYYTVLSLAPLLIVVIMIAGAVFGREAAQGQLNAQIQQMVGREGAEAIQSLLVNAGKNEGSGLASILGLAALLFGASSVVAELRSTMNLVWNVPQKGKGGISSLVKERSYAVALVLGAGFLLLVSLVVSAGLSAVGTYFGQLLPVPGVVFQVLNFVVSLAIISFLFAILFKVLPEIPLRWSDVWPAALCTALLFTIGKTLLGIYIGHAGFGSTYGAAGSLVIVLVWVYYSAQIFFFGAEVAQVYTREYGSNPLHEGIPNQDDQHAAAPKSIDDKPDKLAHQAASGNAGLPPARAPLTPEEEQKQVAGGLAVVVGSLLAAATSLAQVFRRRRGA